MLTYNITNRVETQRKLKWRQALRIATQSPESWTRKAAEWNLVFITLTQTKRRAGKPRQKMERRLVNDFVKDEETEAAQSNVLKNSNTWLIVAKNVYEWEKERQYTKHVVDD